MPPAPTTVPARSSGPLTAETLPAASDLGTGWRARIEGADPEEGVGNGSPFQERYPAEVVQTTIPLGCAQRSPSPVPTNVLQATYRHRDTGAYAVALRMRFATVAQAIDFAEIRRQDLVACQGQPDDPYSGAPAPVLSVAGSTRRQASRYQLIGQAQVWVSGLRVTGTDVLTLDSDAKPSDTLDWGALGLVAP